MSTVFGKLKTSKTPQRISAGTPCKNCPHSHLDHSMYSPWMCYVENCACIGLKIDVKSGDFPKRYQP